MLSEFQIKTEILTFICLKEFSFFSLSLSLCLSLKTHSTSNTMLLSTWGEIRLSLILDFLTSTFGAKFQSGNEFYSTIKSKEWEHCETLNNLLLHHTLLHLTSQSGPSPVPNRSRGCVHCLYISTWVHASGVTRWSTLGWFSQSVLFIEWALKCYKWNRGLWAHI